jgi:hypothetical protein
MHGYERVARIHRRAGRTCPFLPARARSCRPKFSMVRKGSSVRVRQRACADLQGKAGPVGVPCRDLAQRGHQDQLAGLASSIRRFGRARDPDADQRALLQTAIELDDRALADLASGRRRLQRELGDPTRSDPNAAPPPTLCTSSNANITSCAASSRTQSSTAVRTGSSTRLATGHRHPATTRPGIEPPAR